MKKLILTPVCLLLAIVVFAQDYLQDSAWVKDNYTKLEQYIPMRDGVKLFTSIYIPKDKSEAHPILMTRTPYSCAPYGTDFSSRLWQRYWKYYARENYIFVTQDVRGRWMSEGEFVDVRPFNKNKTGNQTDEASDTYDAIEWIVKNLPNNNGKVGVFGISYPGFYSSMAAASGHPAIKAVSPQAPVTDWFMGDDFHHNGAFFPMDGFAFYSSFGKPRPAPTTVGSPGFTFPIRDNYKFYLEAGSLKKLAEYMGDSIKFWKDMYAHPNYDDWWQARDARVAMQNIRPAMLVVGGLFDAEDCFGAWSLYKAIEKNNPSATNNLVMGPWYHGQWAGADGTKLGNVEFGSNTSFWYQDNVEIPFFNYYLKGKGDDPKLAEATIFVTGENKWHKFTQWPPKEMKETPVFPAANNSLSWSAGNGSNFYQYTSDPAHPVPYTEDVHFGRTREYMTDDQRFASRRPDVLTFETPVLNEDLTLAGPVVADIITAITGTDADFIVKIIDVFPADFSYPTDVSQQGKSAGGSYPMGGYQMLVRGEIMRGKFRNSFELPQAFAPNKQTQVKFTLPDVAHTFKKGHKLMIQVQSTWFPLADRNPQKFMNIYQADANDFQKADIRIYYGNSNQTKFLLPILK